ncbi:MAG: ABC transporter substrate-binding protein, partial [Oscillospiraceae bacterium]|nr:ABC transporter substrate-binding protein [Oscillospiraceae bacterium]
LVPSDYMIERLIKSDMLQPLNTEKIPNKELLAEEVKNLPFDPNNTYAIPYFWGSVGLVYNEKNVDPKDIEEQGWNVLKNPKYAGHIYVYDSERDAFLMPLKALGYSANTGNEEEIQEAYEWLLELNATMSPAYVTDEVIDGMIGGLKDIAVVYSGDAAVILNENPDMRFAMPKEGTNIWCDGMIIPANAENPALAHEFINYMLTYDAAYDNAETVGYSSPNAEVLKKMAEDPELYGSNEAYLPRSGYELDEVYTDNPTLKKMISELWIKVKAT